MIKRLKTSAGLVAGLAALSLGGAAIASAASSSTPAHAKAPVKHEATSGRDTDNVQSGDQTTPDTKASSTTRNATEVTTGPDTGNTQSGDQTTPDPAGPSSETSSESSGESAANSDGPGGYADPAGSNANTQQQGQN
jgi:hypothetical protein